jgi:hypothetical protein
VGPGGVNHAPRCPRRCPLRNCHLQANDRKVQRFAPFGGSDGLVCLGFAVVGAQGGRATVQAIGGQPSDDCGDCRARLADGNHARVDGFVSLGVVASAALVALGLPRADPFVGMLITLVILRITWDSWQTIRATKPGEPLADD